MIQNLIISLWWFVGQDKEPPVSGYFTILAMLAPAHAKGWSRSLIKFLYVQLMIIIMIIVVRKCRITDYSLTCNYDYPNPDYMALSYQLPNVVHVVIGFYLQQPWLNLSTALRRLNKWMSH